MGDDDQLYFRQWLSGVDVATGDPVARQMANHAYAIGDRAAGTCLLVDPAYDVAGLLGAVAADGLEVAGVLVTHHHPDHVGGALGGWRIEGLAALLELVDVPVHAHRREVELVEAWTGVGASSLVGHDGGDVVRAGEVDVELLHTPGHTPGSQCFLVGGRLVSGDTLFLDGCGRTDLTGSDPGEMYDSLRRLAALPGDVEVWPGHRYSPEPSAPLGTVAARNVALRPLPRDAWLAMCAPR